MNDAKNAPMKIPFTNEFKGDSFSMKLSLIKR